MLLAVTPARIRRIKPIVESALARLFDGMSPPCTCSSSGSSTSTSATPFDASSFSKNRERLLAYDVSRAFFAEVVAEARQRRLLSADHFTVDGTLLEAR